jgi:hypothetical protein
MSITNVYHEIHEEAVMDYGYGEVGETVITCIILLGKPLGNAHLEEQEENGRITLRQIRGG